MDVLDEIASNSWGVSQILVIALHSDALDHQRDALPHADAHRAQAVAAAGAFQLVERRRHQPRAGSAQRVADARSRRRSD